MNKEIYRFEPLTKDNKKIWFEKARDCRYAPVNAIDEGLIGSQLKNNSFLGVIIYEIRSGSPIALFPAEILNKRIGPVCFRILKSRFGGLLILDDNISKPPSLKDFVFREVINGYYAKRHKIDYISVELPPKIMIERPFCAHSLVPFYGSDAEINSILYARLEEGLLNKFKYNTRREIAKGIENLNDLQVVCEKDKKTLKFLLDLESYKAKALNIEPVAASHFEHILNSKFYHVLVAVKEGRPLSAVIYTYCNNVSTFHYNAVNEKGKKLFINKGLLFASMENSRRMGADYFVLGNGREHAAGQSVKRQLGRLVFFKRSFSTNEVSTFRFKYPLTYKGGIGLWIDRLRKKRNS